MKKGATLVEYLDAFTKFLDDFIGHDEIVRDEEKSLCLISFLLNMYELFILKIVHG